MTHYSLEIEGPIHDDVVDFDLVCDDIICSTSSGFKDQLTCNNKEPLLSAEMQNKRKPKEPHSKIPVLQNRRRAFKRQSHSAPVIPAYPPVESPSISFSIPFPPPQISKLLLETSQQPRMDDVWDSQVNEFLNKLDHPNSFSTGAKQEKKQETLEDFLKAWKGVNDSRDVLRTWNLAGHTEKSLWKLFKKERVRSKSHLRFIFVQELISNLEYEKLPDSSISIKELLDATVDYFIKTSKNAFF